MEPLVPLLDHFNPPLSLSHPWRSFHGAWAAAMARLLNAGVLPAGYVAMPFLDRDGPVEIDVAALHTPGSNGSHGGEAWSPTAPAIAVAVDWPAVDEVRVEIRTDDGEARLAAAVEFVSPANKDRPRSRSAFVAKCADYLSRGCGLVVVDAVTTRRADLHAELMEVLRVAPPGGPTGSMAAVAYRPIGGRNAGQLLGWPAPLAINQTLPTVPLWLGEEDVVRLELEVSHSATCRDLAIRQAG